VPDCDKCEQATAVTCSPTCVPNGDHLIQEHVTPNIPPILD
ncbi:2203_t:CDS:1, partial [Dentiscutata erythropus]